MPRRAPAAPTLVLLVRHGQTATTGTVSSGLMITRRPLSRVDSCSE